MSKSMRINAIAKDFVYSCVGDYKTTVTDYNVTYHQINPSLPLFKEHCIAYGLSCNVPQCKLEKLITKAEYQADKFNYCERWL